MRQDMTYYTWDGYTWHHGVGVSTKACMLSTGANYVVVSRLNRIRVTKSSKMNSAYYHPQCQTPYYHDKNMEYSV